MKKKIFYFITAISLFSFVSKGQSFSLQLIDTIKYDSPGSVIALKDSLVNNSATGYYVDVFRVVNDTAPNWETSFCLDVCYLPSVDSARVYLLPNAGQVFILDFYSDTLPDSSTVYMKFKNVADPSNVVYQKFYGVTINGLGINPLYAQKDVSVKMFPSPVTSGGSFTMHISDTNNRHDFSMIIYNLIGEKITELKGLKQGDNFLRTSLQPGLFLYTLSSEGKPLNSGKIMVTD